MNFLNIPLNRDSHRKIIHVDMDAFYASIEERDNPIYKKKALIISRDPRQSGGHGVVATANYIARSYGVCSAMSAIEAAKLVPRNLLVFQPPNFKKYRYVSSQIHNIFNHITDKLELVALDEAYLDVTDNKISNNDDILIAKKIQHDIYNKTHLICSIGVSYNKFLSKMASKYCKPNGFTVIRSYDAIPFLRRMPISKFQGVGKKTLLKLLKMNINTGNDLLKVSLDTLIDNFGKSGYLLYLHAHGIDNRPVNNKKRKSIGRENTYDKCLTNNYEVIEKLKILSKKIFNDLNSKNLLGNVIILKIRDDNFNTFTHRKKLKKSIYKYQDIFQNALSLWDQYRSNVNNVRLIGISLTDLSFNKYEDITLPLFNKE